MASQITSLTIVYSTVYSSADQRKHQSSAPLAFVGGIHRWLVNSPHKGPVTRKMFPFDDVIMSNMRHANPVIQHIYMLSITPAANFNAWVKCRISYMTHAHTPIRKSRCTYVRVSFRFCLYSNLLGIKFSTYLNIIDDLHLQYDFGSHTKCIEVQFSI